MLRSHGEKLMYVIDFQFYVSEIITATINGYQIGKIYSQYINRTPEWTIISFQYRLNEKRVQHNLKIQSVLFYGYLTAHT